MATTNNKKVRLVGLISIILGAIFVVAGVVTWGAVTSQLAAENITVSKDAPILAGQPVNDPITAYIQAGVINLLDPRVIVLGGGLSNNPRILPGVRANLERYTVAKDLRTQLVFAAHGDASGVRGAAWLGEHL